MAFGTVLVVHCGFTADTKFLAIYDFFFPLWYTLDTPLFIYSQTTMTTLLSIMYSFSRKRLGLFRVLCFFVHDGVLFLVLCPFFVTFQNVKNALRGLGCCRIHGNVRMITPVEIFVYYSFE